MKSRPPITIIIATYNSAKTLSKTLESVSKQSYPKSKVKILVIDGGSTDRTLEIARHYHCQVVKNAKVFPAWAKYIGFLQARTKYIMYLDSDEVIENKNSISKKMQTFQKPGVAAVTGSGYKSPKGFPVLNDYINEFGDPFSFFIYRLSKDHRFFVDSMENRYTVVKEAKNYLIFDFTDSFGLPIFELVAMGSIVDRNYVRKQFAEIEKKPGLIPHLFYLMVSKGALVAIVKHDPLIHYSSNSLHVYFRKIRSRAMSNIFTTAKEGFRGRNELSGGNVFKKYLFLPYALTLVLPCLDAFYLSVTRRNVGYLLHIPLTLYTAMLILYYTGMRAAGVRYEANAYG